MELGSGDGDTVTNMLDKLHNHEIMVLEEMTSKEKSGGLIRKAAEDPSSTTEMNHVRTYNEEARTLPKQDHQRQIDEMLREHGECPLEIPVFESKGSDLPKDTKFVFPILKWGPNNQILGFFEAMHLAKFLNRSVVLPVFHLHDTDRVSNASVRHDAVPGELRLNTPAIPNLVTMADYNHFCHKEASAVYLPTDVFASGIYGRIITWEEMTGISILDPKQRFRAFKHHIEEYPPIADIRRHFKTDGDNYIRQNWTNIFKESRERCAIFALPYRLLVNIPKFAQINDKEAYDFPEIIRTIQNEFTSIFPNINVGIHWRWSRSDWSARCYRHSNPPEECKVIHHLNYTRLSENVINRANGGHAYIASPVTEWGVMEMISSAFPKSQTKILYGADLTKFLQLRYKSCEWFSKWKGEIISMVEQAILSTTWEFYGWPVSSWSARIGKIRKMFGVGDPKFKRQNTVSLMKASIVNGYVLPVKPTKTPPKKKEKKPKNKANKKKSSGNKR